MCDEKENKDNRYIQLQTREEMLVSNRLKVEFLAFFNCREVLTVDGEDWENDEEVRLE